MGGAQGRDLSEREVEDTWTARTCFDCRNGGGCVEKDEARRSSIIIKKGFQPAATTIIPKLPAYVCLRDSEAQRPSGAPLAAPWHTGTELPDGVCGRNESAVTWVSGLLEEQAPFGVEKRPSWKARAEELHKELDQQIGAIATKIHSPRAVGSCFIGSGNSLHSPHSPRSPRSPPSLKSEFLAVTIKKQE